jgi:quercetin dioxygenase-like cupin family protein
MLALFFITVGPLAAQTPDLKDAKVTPLVTKALLPGKGVTVLGVEYMPGGSDPIRRHNAHGFIYVLEGTIVMQVKSGKEVTRRQGKLFMKVPTNIHIVGRNASSTNRQSFW